MSEKIGFIGLGVMGRPMAENLVKAGYTVNVFDLNKDAVSALEKRGAVGKNSIKDIALDSSIVITMLPNSPQVEQVVSSDDGLLLNMAEGSIVIDMSTIAPHASREFSRRFEERGVSFFDAPVSGGQVGAINGNLSIMLGGSETLLPRIMPTLEVLGGSITYLGASGAGQAAKMCNQMICAMNIHAICEAFTLGYSEGLDMIALKKVISGGSANSWMLENLGDKIISKDISAGFRIDLQVKDLKIAIESAFLRNVPVPGTMLSTSMYVEAQAHDEGSNGNQSLFTVFDRLANH